MSVMHCRDHSTGTLREATWMGEVGVDLCGSYLRIM